MIEHERTPQESNLEVTTTNSEELKNHPIGTVVLEREKRCWVFVYIIVINIFINFDHGYFPAATEEFKRDFQINSSLLGLFGSSVYFGNLIGNLILI
jgi:hypothetical protein